MASSSHHNPKPGPSRQPSNKEGNIDKLVYLLRIAREQKDIELFKKVKKIIDEKGLEPYLRQL